MLTYNLILLESIRSNNLTPVIKFGSLLRGGLGNLATWHLPCGQVGPPARWAAMSNIEGESRTEEMDAMGPYLERESSTRINYWQGTRVFSYATAHGPGYLISQGRFD